MSEPRTVREPHAFARYTAATLLAPTIIATGYTAFDHIQPTLTSLLVTLAVLALGLQQVAWIVTSEVWPGRGWSGPRLVTSRWALLVGAAGSVAVLGYGVAHGRPLLIWALPVASATGVALLAMTRWDAERPRWSVVGGLGPGLVVVGACVVAALGSPAASPVMNAVLVALLCAIAAMVLVGQVWWDRVVHELTVARERVVTQAVMEERLRFAGELHDLQGHELQAVLVQSDLARALLEARGGEAVPEAMDVLESISASTRETLRQTREIAHGYRRVGFTEEVANAQRVLAAAGIEVSVEGATEQVEGDLAALGGLLIREAATNILRHSQADRMSIRVDPQASGTLLRITDPGPARRDSGFAAGSGLRSIAERARRLGYDVLAGPDEAGWAIQVRRIEVERSEVRGHQG